MEAKMLYQQGDILIERTEEIPEQLDSIPPKNGRYILAEGEATGHAHAITDNISLLKDLSTGSLYCVADDSFTLRHEEHKPITIPPGLYIVRQVREYDYFKVEKNQRITPVTD